MNVRFQNMKASVFAGLLGLSLLATACSQTAAVLEPAPKRIFPVAENQAVVPGKLPFVADTTIKNVILIIGDGTGLAQITSGQYAVVGTQGRLHMQTMPVAGFVNTTSSDNLITDSASGATAYSCGLKTYNSAIGVNPEKVPCNTLTELAAAKGMSTGLVATSTIVHATPASFAAHVEKRSLYNDIAEDFSRSQVDVFLGGGRKFFLPNTEEGSARTDDANLIGLFKQKGYDYVENADELGKSTGDKILGLFALDAIDYSPEQPSLAEMTAKALDVLNRNEQGFFLMVEGSQIDWGGHANDVEYVIREVQRFDEAIKVILDFAIADGQTLVVQTADHETGGMTLQKQYNGGKELEINWTTGGHTGTPIPLMAYGPHATDFSGWVDNTYVGRRIAELLQLGEFPSLKTEGN